MKKALFGLVFTGLLAMTSTGYAIDFTPTGSVLTVSYTEPLTNTDGSALNDLRDTVVRYRICPVVGTCTASFVDGNVVPATSSSGGGSITTQQTVAVVPGQEVNVEVFALARDTSGNVSPESSHVVKRVDRLSPSAPQ